MGVTKSAVSNWERGFGVRNHHLIKLQEELVASNLNGPRDVFEKNNDISIPIPGITFIGLPDIAPRVNACIEGVKHFSRYCQLNYSLPRTDFNYFLRDTPYELRSPRFVERLRAREIEFLRVETFFRPSKFVLALFSAKDLLHTGYQINFFLKPPKSIPVINYWSFDDEVFLLGGHREIGPPSTKSILVVEKREPIASFLTDYWNTLWSNSEELWESPALKNAECVAKSLRLSETWDRIKRTIFEAKTYKQVIDGLPEIFPPLPV